MVSPTPAPIKPSLVPVPTAPARAIRQTGWRLLPLLLALVGLMLTWVAHRKIAEIQEERARTYFDFRVREAIEHIEQRMESYQQVLRGVMGLFAANGDVSRQEFREYNEQLRIAEFYPGIQGIGYAERIRPGQLAPHIAAVRREGFPNYAVRSSDGPDAFYSAIIYLEPFTGRNLRAFGYDMYSEPTRRTAMQQAMDTGRITLSGKVRLLQENNAKEQAGFLVYAPVYDHRRPTSTTEERRAHLRGWVYQPFRMDDLLQGVFGEQAHDLHIEIYDGETITPGGLMHASQHTEDRASDERYIRTQTLRLMGHPWTLRIAATQDIEERVSNGLLAKTVAVGGVALTALLSVLLWNLITSRSRALALAHNMTEELAEERARLQAILDGTHVGTWEWNVQTGATLFNEHWAELIGYTLDELGPTTIQTWIEHTHPDDLARSNAALQDCFERRREYYECEARMRHRDGHWVWVLDRGKVARWTPEGKPLLMYGTHQDISAHKAQEAAAWHSAQHDVLTGLPNRDLLADRLAQGLRHAEREHTALALLFVDLDDFKTINDTYGHAGGDCVLQTVAQRLQDAVRASDTVARTGGDEFVVMLPDIGDHTQALALADKLRQAILPPIPHAQQQITLSISIGVAVYPEHGLDSDTLVRHADEAMYQAKHSGKNNVCLYAKAPSAPLPQNG